MLSAAGPDLDRQIERKLNGDAKKKTPPYSTSEKAASRLLRRLELQDMPCTVEQVEGVWYCTFWIVYESSRERLSTGSGETRALSIARAVMNARLGADPRHCVATETMSSRLHWTQKHASVSTTQSCAGCGAALPPRNREATNRAKKPICSVCAWRAARFGERSSRESDSRPFRIRGENPAGRG